MVKALVKKYLEDWMWSDRSIYHPGARKIKLPPIPGLYKLFNGKPQFSSREVLAFRAAGVRVIMHVNGDIEVFPQQDENIPPCDY